MKVFCIVMALLTTISVSGQITFSYEETLQMAKHNTERRYLKDYVEVQNSQIDSLIYQLQLTQTALEICLSNHRDFEYLIENYSKIDSTRQVQANELLKTIDKKDKIIKRQNGKIKALKIALPIVTVSAFIVGFLI